MLHSWSWWWSNQDINWKQSTLYHAGDSQHTQSIQIDKVISEYEECIFYFTEKNPTNFLANTILATSHFWGPSNILSPVQWANTMSCQMSRRPRFLWTIFFQRVGELRQPWGKNVYCRLSQVKESCFWSSFPMVIERYTCQSHNCKLCTWSNINLF